MAAIRDLVREVVEAYAVSGANFESFLAISPDGSLFTVLDIANDNEGHRFAATSVVVRVIGKQVVVEHDDNDKPLVDALVQAGVPREQIVLAYAGEPVPKTA
jgi:hypothetical protein